MQDDQLRRKLAELLPSQRQEAEEYLEKLANGGNLVIPPSTTLTTNKAPQPAGLTEAELAKWEFEPLTWAVENLFVVGGGSILAGKAKIGKSWLLYQLAIAVADGTMFLDRYQATQGEALMLAIEDGARRASSRLRRLRSALGSTPSNRLTVEGRWPKADEGGYSAMAEWCESHPERRLIIIDNLRVFSAVGYSYRTDSAIVQRVCEFAERWRVAIVFAMHMYKGGVSKASPDWLDKIQGSVGATGAATAITGLARGRAEDTGVLRVTGKDIPEADIPLSFDPETNVWSIDDAPAEPAEELSAERRALLYEIGMRPGSSVRELAAILGKTQNAVKQLAFKMAKSGECINDSGRYYTPEGWRLAQGGASQMEIATLAGAHLRVMPKED
jgi:hypothetical protein